MGQSVEILEDDDGFAIIGGSSEVAEFLRANRLEDVSSAELDMPRLSRVMHAGGVASQVSSTIAASSGRWVKLSEESAQAVKRHGFMPAKSGGHHLMAGKPGEVKQWLQTAGKAPPLLSPPVALAALATAMQQRAMQQQMDEIAEYLEKIEEKLDAVLQSQKDSIQSGIAGVAGMIRSAYSMRENTGGISSITWSKLQGQESRVLELQDYALSQLNRGIEQVREAAADGDPSKARKALEAQAEIQEWLVALARLSHHLHHLHLLELDYHLEAELEGMDGHRRGLASTRDHFRVQIATSTQLLSEALQNIVNRANAKVLFHPRHSPAAARDALHFAGSVDAFHAALGLDDAVSADELEVRGWLEEAKCKGEVAFDNALEVAGRVKRIGGHTANGAQSVAGQLRRRVPSLRKGDIDGETVDEDS